MLAMAHLSFACVNKECFPVTGAQGHPVTKTRWYSWWWLTARLQSTNHLYKPEHLAVPLGSTYAHAIRPGTYGDWNLMKNDSENLTVAKTWHQQQMMLYDMRLCVAMNCCSDLNTVYFYSWADKSKLRTCTKEVGNALHSHLTSITNDLKHYTSQGKVVQSASGNENSYSALLEKQNSRQDNIHMGYAPKNGLANCLHKSCLINSLFHPPWYWPLPSQPFLVFDDVNLVTHCFQDVLNDLSKLQRSNRIHILPIW